MAMPVLVFFVLVFFYGEEVVAALEAGIDR
jgi:hypothetical protein